MDQDQQLFRFCPKCGAPIDPGQQFCDQCGARLADYLPQTAQANAHVAQKTSQTPAAKQEKVTEAQVVNKTASTQPAAAADIAAAAKERAPKPAAPITKTISAGEEKPNSALRVAQPAETIPSPPVHAQAAAAGVVLLDAETVPHFSYAALLGYLFGFACWFVNLWGVTGCLAVGISIWALARKPHRLSKVLAILGLLGGSINAAYAILVWINGGMPS